MAQILTLAFTLERPHIDIVPVLSRSSLYQLRSGRSLTASVLHVVVSFPEDSGESVGHRSESDHFSDTKDLPI